jgi:CRISPR-associated protein Cas5t
MRPGLPRVEIAIGALSLPEVQSIYQQLHNYPVGTTGKERADDCKGAKYNIQPIRREFLSSLDGYICLRGNDALEARVRTGLREGTRWMPEGHPRYGIPFLGDNSFMVDVLQEESSPGPAYWYMRATNDDAGQGEGRCRLTTWIDRADMTRTQTLLFARTKDPVSPILDEDKVWTLIEPPTESHVIKRRRKAK